MNIILIILGSIGALVLLLLIIALFTKRSYTIERSIIVSKPNNEVFNYVRFLKNQDHYNKWVMMDPNMKKAYKGNDGAVGFIYGWDGNSKAGAGEQEIRKIEDDKRVETEVRFKRPFKAVAYSLIETGSVISPIDQQRSTSVKWAFSSTLKYPANIFLLMNVEKALARDVELSLSNLKTILEK